MVTRLVHDFSDSLTIAALLCDSAQIPRGDERNATITGLERWLRTRGAVSGDYEKLHSFARALSNDLGSLPREIFEAAMHLAARGTFEAAGVGRFTGIAPAHLRGMSLEKIASYVLSWERPRARVKRHAPKAAKRSKKRR